MPTVITNSALNAYRQCPKYYDWTYKQGYRPVVESEAIRFGASLHEVLNEVWKNGRKESGLAVVSRIAEEAKNGAQNEEEFANAEYAVALLRAVTRAYCEHHNLVEYETIEVEKEFGFTIDKPEFKDIVLAGKIDKIVRRADGQVSIVEHKSTTMAIDDPAAPYWRRLAMDPQISTYFLGAASLGYNVTTCVYDVIRRPMHQPLMATPPDKMKFKKDGTPYSNCRTQNETPEEYETRVLSNILQEQSKYFARQEVVRLPREMEAHLADLKNVIVALGHSQSEGFHKNPLACFGRGTCPFLDACCGLEDPAGSERFRKSEATNGHEELEGV